ncbi:hypothetical protein ACI2LF_09375 [Kribbella sp. NPDC020789]
MADEAEEMLDILFKQVRRLARQLDSFRQQLQRNQQARMPRSLMEEIRDIRQQHPGIDRAMNDRPPVDQYARIEHQLRVLREREADLRRQLDDRQRELDANQDLNRDGNPDDSRNDIEERDEVTDDRDERDEQEQQDERERDEQEQREREEEERQRQEEEERRREEEERRRREQEESRGETGTPGVGAPAAVLGAEAAGAAAAEDFERDSREMEQQFEAESQQIHENFEARSEQMRSDFEANRDSLGLGDEVDQARTEAEQRGEPSPREVAEQQAGDQQGQDPVETRQEPLQQEQPQQEQSQQAQQERVQQEQREQAQRDQQAQQEQPGETRDPQEQAQEQVREQQEREQPAEQQGRDELSQDELGQDELGRDGEQPESRREEETERQEQDREQADVGTGEAFPTGGDHQVADRASEQAEQPDGRVHAEDGLLEQERLDRENQNGTGPQQDGATRSQMSPDEMQRNQNAYSAGTASPAGAVGSRPNGEALQGARGGQTAAQLHAKTTQRGREQGGHELSKG